MPLGQWFQSQQRSGGSQPDCDWGYPGTHLSLAAPRGTHLSLAAPGGTRVPISAWLRLGVPGYPSQLGCAWGTRVPISAWLRLGVPGYPSQLGCAWGYPGTHLNSSSRAPAVPRCLDPLLSGGGGGGGGHVEDLSVSGLWNEQRRGWHINLLEMEAAVRSSQDLWDTVSIYS